MKQTLLLVMAIMLLAGCDNGKLLGGSDPQIEVLFTTDTDAARGMRTLSRAILPSVDSTYDSELYGEFVTSVTPTEFILPVTDITIYRPTGNVPFLSIRGDADDGSYNPDDYYADFTRSLPINLMYEIPFGTYDYLSINIMPEAFSNSMMGGSYKLSEWDYESSIRFTLPSEYDGITVSQLEDTYYTNVVNYFTRESLDVFTNSMALMAVPIFNDGAVDNYSMHLAPKGYLYGSMVTDPRIENTAGEPVTVGDYMTAPGFESSAGHGLGTTNPVPIGPMNQIEIPEGFVFLQVTFIYDISNIVQLYAGPDNIPYTEDDKVILAPNFWERLAVYYTVY